MINPENIRKILMLAGVTELEVHMLSDQKKVSLSYKYVGDRLVKCFNFKQVEDFFNEPPGSIGQPPESTARPPG